MAEILIEVDDVHLTYPGPPPVNALRGVTMQVPDDACLAIVGPSGSGKSTLLNILGLLERPTSGEVRLAGKSIAGLSDAAVTRLRGRSIGFVFQHFHLIKERTCLENVQLALSLQGVPRRDRRARAAQVLAEVGLTHRAHAVTGDLSGGEKQRVAVARALAGSPSLLLCDEPTGNLDSRSTESVLALLREQHERGVALAVVTHDPEVARWADTIVEVTDGVISRRSDQ